MRKKLLKKGNWRIVVVLLTGVLLSAISLLIDQDRFALWGWIGSRLPEELRAEFDWARGILREKASLFYNLSVTLGTILAAVVVLHYSMQDSKREGIPRRTITAYQYGSYTIPVLFFWQMICLFGLTALLMFDLPNCLYAGLLYVGIIQVWIIMIIVKTSSFHRNCNIIYKTEKTQFIWLLRYDNIADRQYIWSYLIHHMEQVMAGDGMLFERVEIIRKLLEVPDNVRKKCIIRCRGACRKERWRQVTHEYLFGNLRATIARLQPESEDAFFNVLLRFLSEMGRQMAGIECTKGEKKAKESRTKRNIAMEMSYLTIAAAVMLSVVYSGLARAGVFCVHALNEAPVSERLRSRLLFLYLLSLEFVYRTGSARPFALDFEDIRDFDKAWERQEMEESEIYGYYLPYWIVWSLETGIPMERSLRYYRNAVKALLGKGKRSVLMSYVYWMKGTKDGRNANQDFKVVE